MVGHKSFFLLNKTVHEKCANTDLFEGTLFNYYKVVQQSLVYSEKGSAKLLSSYLRHPYVVIRLMLAVKNLRRKTKQAEPVRLKKYIVLEKGRERYDAEGNAVSMYFHNIIEALGRENVTVIRTGGKKMQQQADYDLDQLKLELPVYRLEPQAGQVLKDILFVKKKIIASGRFTAKEIAYITSAFHVFFEEFLFYSKLFCCSPVKESFCLFVMHYHNEALLAALKMNGIMSVELQHGLISANDLYYVYPEKGAGFYRRCLFADHLLVYGMHWKEVIRRGGEYKDRVTVAGDYTYGAAGPKGTDVKENIIFVGAQKNMHDIYVPYLEQLCALLQKDSPGWRVITKLHPAEKNSNIYHQVLSKFPNHSIVGNESDLYDLLRRSRIQVSIYSTTFFDALGYGVFNLSLQDYSEYSDYARLMVEDGIAYPLHYAENPVTLYEQLHASVKLPERNYYYSKFDKTEFRNLLNGLN